MKTKKQLTNKQIQEVLRTENPTEIFRACKIVTGSAKSGDVFDFIERFAPTRRVCGMACQLAYSPRSSRNDYKKAVDWRKEFGKEQAFKGANIRQIAVALLRKEMAQPLTDYTKLPMITSSGILAFASPAYRERDYNWRYIMPYKGNERFCDLLCNVGEEYFKREGGRL